MGGPCSEKRLKTSYFRTGPTHFRYSEHLDRSGNDPPRVNMPAGSPRVSLNPRLLSVSFFQFKDTGGSRTPAGALRVNIVSARTSP